jgi:osomolarity two-component system, phosphorelay intermediate protein YPD1
LLGPVDQGLILDDFEQHDGGEGGIPDLGDSVDGVTFSQILEMDDSEEDREFSKSIVTGFFEQAEETFDKITAAL